MKPAHLFERRVIAACDALPPDSAVSARDALVQQCLTILEATGFERPLLLELRSRATSQPFVRPDTPVVGTATAGDSLAVLAEFLVNHIADTLSIQSPLEALSYAALQYASVVLDVVYWNGGLPDERLMELEFAAFVAGLRGNDQVWSPSVRDLLRSRLKT